MTKNRDPKKESLAEIAVDPDVLARELALEIEIDPLEQIDEDSFSKGLNITQECDEALNCLLYTSPSPRDISGSRMPSSA